MGCIFSSPIVEETNGRPSRRNTFNLKNEQGEFKTSAHTKEFNASQWEDDTKKIWERPLASLSCHMDLPRLGHKIKIFQNDELINQIEAGGSKMQIVQDILINLAECCNESPELIESIKSKYYEFVHKDGSGDISQQLKSFLEQIIPNDCKMSHILSLCHQKIVFPAYYSIKQNVFDILPFKDSRGSWQISVFIAEESCRVVHKKIQMGKDSPSGGEGEFSFTWELVIDLDGGQYDDMQKVFVRIPEVTTREDLSPSRQQEIKDIFEQTYPNP